MTRSSGRAPARARLAELMDSRRRDLRLTWDEVAARAGIHRETLRQIRIGKGDIRPLSATGIEDALQWEHGSIDGILEGGEPTVRQLTDAGRADDELSVTRDPTVAELAERLKQQEQTTARLAEENNELRRMFKEITGKPSATYGGGEPETDAPHQAM
jgi:transcriptional regulator with XRE-family HTH domain